MTHNRRLSDRFPTPWPRATAPKNHQKPRSGWWFVLILALSLAIWWAIWQLGVLATASAPLEPYAYSCVTDMECEMEEAMRHRGR